jgi:chitinase
MQPKATSWRPYHRSLATAGLAVVLAAAHCGTDGQNAATSGDAGRVADAGTGDASMRDATDSDGGLTSTDASLRAEGGAAAMDSSAVGDSGGGGPDGASADGADAGSDGGSLAEGGDAGPGDASLAEGGDAGGSSPTDAGPAIDAAAGDGGDGGPAKTSGQWVLGYYVGYQIHDYPIASIDWTGLTHIAFAPLTVKADLSLDQSFSDSDGTGTEDATALATAAHAHGVKALLMLGGAGAGANIATAASSSHRAAFVSTLLDAIGTLGYDGIDLDWEDSVNLDDLVSLAQALRAASPSILLSYPAGAINGNFETVDPRMATLASSLDRFNVQTYYPSTAVAGQGWDSWFSSPLSGASATTPIAIDDTLQRYAAAGVPTGKLGMGTAFYAICYTGGITGPRQPTSGTTQIVGGDNAYPLSAFFASGNTFDTSTNTSRKRDAVAAEPYLAFPSPISDAYCGAPNQYIPYEDETSIAAKGAFSKSHGYGGIIVWTLAEGWLPANASGGRAPNALMQALKTAFIDP